MNGKSLMMLGLAVVFGLIAMFLTRQMLAQEPTKVEEAQDVLVAARDLKEEELLKPDALKVIRMAKSAVPVGAFSAPKDVEERWVKTAMLEGDAVIEKKLGPKGTPPGLVANIPKGMRAFAIDVTEQSGVSGFILPGHRVDVIRYEQDRANQRGESILQDILVLASGQVFTRAEERSLTNRTVTLALTPDQVAIIVAARAKGALSLALRGVNDHEVVARPEPKPTAAETPDPRWKLEEEKRQKLERELAEVKAALAAKAAAPPPAPAPAPVPVRPQARYVAIYRGGPREQGHFERIRIDEPPSAEPGSRTPAPPLPGLDLFDRPVRMEPSGGRPRLQADSVARMPPASETAQPDS
jgi:pilus assembly protein CpaB